MKKLVFIWGPGGVGKSHVAIREVYKSPANKKLLLTLDPSHRLFYLLQKKPSAQLQECQLKSASFSIKATQAQELFDRLHAKAPASENVRLFYQQLVQGLQSFQDYLALIELAEEIHQADYDQIIVDTPPFTEAMGLQHSIEGLSEFFHSSIVQIAQRSGWLNVAVKRLLDIAKVFAGKVAVENSLEFIDWLHLHIDRFQLAAKKLEEMIYAPTTGQIFVLNPESSPLVLEQTKDFFKKTSPPEFIMNKSVIHFDLSTAPQEIRTEFEVRQQRERAWSDRLKASFSQSPCRLLPLQVMGTDEPDELLQFVEAQEKAPLSH
jgi:anion-transporting  ArsA/GET3 family ATPase